LRIGNGETGELDKFWAKPHLLDARRAGACRAAARESLEVVAGNDASACRFPDLATGRSAVVFKLARRLVVIAAVVAAAASAFGAGASAESPQTGSIVRMSALGQCDTQYACWVCKGPVDLDQVTVAVDSTAASVDAIKLADGCTGRIGRITVLTASADGVKVSSGAHDLTVAGGTVLCAGRFGDVHQDGIQVMGGTDIDFVGLSVTCPTANHSAFFVNRAGVADEIPTRVVFRQGYLGSAGTTVDLGTSKKSGVRGSTVCPSTRLGKPISIPDAPSGGGPAAVAPVNVNNRLPATC
jgi:hypothetical protein